MTCVPGMIAPMDIHGLIGLGIRAKREELGLRQEDAAKMFRKGGLPAWRRSTVAQVEAGTRRPSLGDLLLVGLAFDCALADLVPDQAPERIDVGSGATMSAAAVKALLSGVSPLDLPDDEIDTPMDSDLATAVEDWRWGMESVRSAWADREQAREQVRLILEKGSLRRVDDVDVSRSFRPATEAEERAAERLGLQVAYLRAASRALWDRDFEAERDSRAGNGEMTPGSLQGRRGHATRAMLGELRGFLRDIGIIGDTSGEPGDE